MKDYLIRLSYNGYAVRQALMPFKSDVAARLNGDRLQTQTNYEYLEEHSPTNHKPAKGPCGKVEVLKLIWSGEPVRAVPVKKFVVPKTLVKGRRKEKT